MSKPVVIVGIAGLAAALLLLKSALSSSAVSDPSLATAGDEDSNFLNDAGDDVMSMFAAWPSGSEPYQDTIQTAADANGVPVSILAWLLWKESRYNPDIISGAVTSPVGALGIAQFMPATAAQILGSAQAALDPSQAIPGAARYLAQLYSSTGSWTAALAAYNWGLGNVQKKGLENAPAETTDYYTTILAKANQQSGEAYA